MTERCMSEISLNDLPNWSAWPARLLGLETWSIPRRTIEKIDSEYDWDKYARCLVFCSNSGIETLTPEDVKMFETDSRLNETVCVSVGNALYAMQLGDAISRQASMLVETMWSVVEKASVIVELGCGYGYNLWKLSRHFPSKVYLGGDYSQNAALVAKLLFSREPNIIVRQFNLYDYRYDLLEGFQDNDRVVLFTSHAIEQLPSASLVFDVLASYRECVDTVFHFEPCYELHDETLLGLLRRRYAEVNDYNRDLFSVLRSRSDIRIVQVEADAFGLNPLNPTSIIQWEFASS